MARLATYVVAIFNVVWYLALLKYLSNAAFFFLVRSVFALALGFFWQSLNICGLCFLVFDS